jgi:restriction system protein
MASGSRSNNLQREIAAQRRAAEQATRQQARDQVLAYEQSRKDQASQMTTAASDRVSELTGILARSLALPLPQVNLDRLKRTPVKVPLELGSDAHPAPAPRWQDFEPAPPGPVGRLFGGEARYAREREAAELAFAVEGESYQAAEMARQRRVAAARTAHKQRQAAVDAEVAKHNSNIAAFATAVHNSDRHAVSRYFQMLIDQVSDPEGFPRQRLAGYVPESTLLALEWRLPHRTSCRQRSPLDGSRPETRSTPRHAPRRRFGRSIRRSSRNWLSAPYDRFSLPSAQVWSAPSSSMASWTQSTPPLDSRSSPA